MKVDLGQCAICGAKNSKYVEQCYKCGAALPWASGYIAPKNAPQKPVPEPVATPIATPASADAKTVVIAPADDSKITPTIEPNVTPDATPEKSGLSQKARSKVPVPAWALVAGGLGLLVLGMALWALIGKKPMPATVVIAPTPIATTAALAPIAPAGTAQPTVAPTAESTALPTVEPTAAATVAPTTVAAPEAGPTFDELYANLTAGTPQQQELYWKSVQGKKINWRGEFVSLGSAATGPLVINCKSGAGAIKVTINLDATTPQALPKYTLNQSVPFEGLLESRTASEIVVKDGRIN